MLNVGAFYVLVVLSYLGAFYGRGLLWRWLRSAGTRGVEGADPTSLAVPRALEVRTR